MATPIFQPVPCLMVVGPDDELADEAARALPGITHLRVAHAAGAVERMLVTRPLVVIVDESVAGADFEHVAECARDIRAEILRASIPPPANFEPLLRSAVLRAERARAGVSIGPSSADE
jgi:hypothetical protein